MNEAATSVRALEALLVRRRQDESQRESGLVDATRAMEAARDARLRASTVEQDAAHAWSEAREQTRGRPGSVQRMSEATAFAGRRRDQLAAARASLGERRVDEARCEHVLDGARLALAEARGRRETVEKRIAAERALIERMAEARAEEETADLAAARGVRSRP